MAEVNATVTRKGDTDDYTLQDLGWDRVPTWMEGKPLTEMISLKGKTALVTGAGGIGLGRDIANSLMNIAQRLFLWIFLRMFTRLRKMLPKNGA